MSKSEIAAMLSNIKIEETAPTAEPTTGKGKFDANECGTEMGCGSIDC